MRPNYNEWCIKPTEGEGRPMGTPEYQRIFQIVRGPDSTQVPPCAADDIACGRSVADVFAGIECKDRRARAADTKHKMLNWRKPLNVPGSQGENVTVAQQCVFVGAFIYRHRQPRTVEVLKYLLDTDPDLAWGRVRFDTGLMPLYRQYADSTLTLACTKARPDIVKTLLEHPTADYYLPSWCDRNATPVQGNLLIDMIDQVRDYRGPYGKALNEYKYTADEMARLKECEDLLLAFHRRRHGRDQALLEKVMQKGLNKGDSATIKGLCRDLMTFDCALHTQDNMAR